MEISPILQARLLLYSAIFGAVLGVAYDIYNELIRPLERKKTLRAIFGFIGDFALPAVAGVGLVLLCYYFNKGEIRFFSVFGIIAGFFCWRFTFSKLFKHILHLILTTVFSIIRLMLTPVMKIFELLVNIIQKFIYFIYKVLAKSIVLMYNIIVKRGVLKRADKGFLKK